MSDRQRVETALEALKSQGYQTGLWVMGSLEGEKRCSIGMLSRSAFDIHGHLCSAIPLDWSGDAQEIIDAFLEAGEGNFGIDWNEQSDSPIYVNPAASLATYKRGRPRQFPVRQRTTLELSPEVLVTLDNRRGSESRALYLERQLRRDWGMPPLAELVQ